ncbi:vacuolar protein sorting-associated protein 37B isoform X2 [Zootermopsis nevadensis]|uniref:vacuolar protein sorting-associated protein 37B isoform X2 n=1 Tax=Zootermopsis nevadensis TaxID=136037 RepID=UPI000B8ED45B|nr:vacuolar protein sorting-associated protein 37B isoform X2 [Zootermopsis nevadensis]
MIKDFEAEKEMLMARNRSLAEFNLSKEPQLAKGKQCLQVLSETGATLCQRIENKVSLHKQQSSDTTAETTLALLQTAAAESEEESEAIAEKFLEGNLEIDSFLEQFTARRKLTHLRRVKADKMAEILTRQHNAPRQNSVSSPAQGHTHHAASSYIPLPPVTGSVPYPTTGMYMPIPGPYGPNVF